MSMAVTTKTAHFVPFNWYSISFSSDSSLIFFALLFAYFHSAFFSLIKMTHTDKSNHRSSSSSCQLPHHRLKMSLFLLLLPATFCFFRPSLAEFSDAYSQPVRPYSYHLTGGISSSAQSSQDYNFADNYHFSQLPLSANRFNKFRNADTEAADSPYSSPEGDDKESSLYSGPQFILEPEEQADQSYRQPLPYSNLSSVSITCKVAGYPTPRIDWRVDNISLSFINTHPSSSSSSSASHQQHFSNSGDDDHQQQQEEQRQTLFSPQLNALVRLRNDGQTLLIGGQNKDFAGRNSSSSSAYSSFYSQLHHHHHQQHQHFQPRQIECLASNQFGVIISRPVYVQQGLLWPASQLFVCMLFYFILFVNHNIALVFWPSANTIKMLFCFFGLSVSGTSVSVCLSNPSNKPLSLSVRLSLFVLFLFLFSILQTLTIVSFFITGKNFSVFHLTLSLSRAAATAATLPLKVIRFWQI